MKRKILSVILTLAMALSLLPATALAAKFGDTEGHWAEKSIERWSNAGVLNGSNGMFDPNGFMTRGQAAQVFTNLLGLKSTEGAATFSDVAPDAWYADAIAKVNAAGIMGGVGDGKMDPEAPVSREMFFTMFARALGIKPQESTSGAPADGASWSAGYINALTDKGFVKGTDNGVEALATMNRASMAALLDQTVTTYANTDGATVEAAPTGVTLVVADNVTVTGTADTVVVAAEEGSVNLNKATVETLNVVSADAEVNIGAGSKVETVAVAETASDANVAVASGATVQTMETAAENTAIDNRGVIASVSVAETASGAELTAASGSYTGTVETAAAGTSVSGSGAVAKVETSGDAASGTDAASVTTRGTTVETTTESGATTTSTNSGTVPATSSTNATAATAAATATGNAAPATQTASSGGGTTYYSVSYNANGGTGTVAAQSAAAGSSVTLSDNAFAEPAASEAYYSFVGWNTMANGKGTTYAAGASFTVSSNTTLYAQWAVTTAVELTAAIATDANPILLGSTDALKALATNVNNSATHDGAVAQGYQLVADVDISGADWTPIGTATYAFSGTFDGGNHTISGLTISGSTENAALFGVTKGTVSISDLALTGVNINTTGNKAAGLIAFIGNKEAVECNTTISNVTVSGSITGAEKVGGIVAQAPYSNTTGNTTFTNCTNNAAVTATSTAPGDIQRAGGILSTAGGANTNTITLTNCSNTGNITASAGWAGAMVSCLNQKKVDAISTASLFNTSGCTNSGTLNGTKTAMIYQEQGAEFPTSGYTSGPNRGVDYLAMVLSSTYFNNVGTDGQPVPAAKKVTFSGLKTDAHFSSNTYAVETVNVEWFPAGTTTSAMSSEYVCYIGVDGSFLAFDSLIGAEMACLNAGESHTIVLLKDCNETNMYDFLTQTYDGGKSYYTSWRSLNLKVELDTNGFKYGYPSCVIGGQEVFKVVKGEGTTNDPYRIYGKEDLLALQLAVNNGNTFSGNHFKLMDDINLDSAPWTPIGNGGRSSSSVSGNKFSGTFDGNGKTISGLNVNVSAENNDDARDLASAGLFGAIEGATIKNLTLASPTVASNGNNTGALVGLMKGGTITGVTVTSASVTSNEAAGGIVGRMMGTGIAGGEGADGCTVSGTVSGKKSVGGIVGSMYRYASSAADLVITNCTNSATVTANEDCAGGIVGFSFGNVSNCTNNGAVTSNNTTDVNGYAGGIVGEQRHGGTISGNTNSAAISGRAYVGGIVGGADYQAAYGTQTDITISNNTNTGSATATSGSYAGEILGLNGSTGSFHVIVTPAAS